MKTPLAQIPDSGILDVQVAPFGLFHGVINKADGTKQPFVQQLDEAAFGRVLDAWNKAGSPELLIDVDHFSCEKSGSTRAFAWAKNLRIESGRGLVADFAFTPAGRDAVNGREYRFVSPVFNVSKNGEIASLSSVALTNKPNLPVACVLNRSETGVTDVEDQKGKPAMDKIKSLLGLGADATPEDVAAAIEALQKEVADAKANALNREAEKCADDNKDRIENRQSFIDLYVKNGKEVALQFLAAIKQPAPAVQPAQQVLNSKTVATPAAGTSKLREGLEQCRNAAERCAYITAHAAEFAAEAK